VTGPLLVDTSDRRLAAVDLRLRGSALTEGRSGWLWVLELPARVGKASFAGTDLVWSADGDGVPVEARRLLHAVTAGRPLEAATGDVPAPPGPARARLGPQSTVDEVVEASIADALHQVIAQDVGLRTAEDPEFVHQARVATRRLRSDLRTFRPLLDRDWAQGLRAELKWVGGAMGVVRDLDVLAERFATGMADVDGDDDRIAEGAGALMRRVLEARRQANDELRALIATDRYYRLLAALEDPPRWAAGVPPDEPAAEVVGRLVRKPWRRLARAVAALPEVPSDHELHEVRLRAKQVRYASEAVAPVVGKAADRLATRAKALQTTLGEHQDAVESKAWLSHLVINHTTPAEAWYAGQRAFLDDEARQESRSAWAADWADLKRKSGRRWLR
jgi:CHAD domain-containing protein